jgi:sulfite exporter TauE/SafE
LVNTLLTPEFFTLVTTTVSLAFVHAILGFDHYLPFIVLSKTHSWSKKKTYIITLICGAAHVLSSLGLGLFGIALGVLLSEMQIFDSLRSNWAAWALICFGLTYCLWGLKRMHKNKSHQHPHLHPDGTFHHHNHNHLGQHSHVHRKKLGTRLTPLALFMIFVLGPCEALIPVLMYPASHGNWVHVAAVVVVFSFVTILTMVLAVRCGLLLADSIKSNIFSRFSDIIAGILLVFSGSAILVFGV